MDPDREGGNQENRLSIASEHGLLGMTGTQLSAWRGSWVKVTGVWQCLGGENKVYF